MSWPGKKSWGGGGAHSFPSRPGRAGRGQILVRFPSGEGCPAAEAGTSSPAPPLESSWSGSSAPGPSPRSSSETPTTSLISPLSLRLVHPAPVTMAALYALKISSMLPPQGLCAYCSLCSRHFPPLSTRLTSSPLQASVKCDLLREALPACSPCLKLQTRPTSPLVHLALSFPTALVTISHITRYTGLCLHLFPVATVTNHHSLVASNNANLFSYSWRGQMFQPGLPGCSRVTGPHSFQRFKEGICFRAFSSFSRLPAILGSISVFKASHGEPCLWR